VRMKISTAVSFGHLGIRSQVFWGEQSHSRVSRSLAPLVVDLMGAARRGAQ
jgi:hypothetical protein